MDPLPFVVASSLLSVVSLGVALFRRRTVVTSNLQVELDLAVEQNKRLVTELAEAKDALHAATLRANSPELLAAWAKLAVPYAEAKGGTAREKLAHAAAYMARLDTADNGEANFTGAQYRGAIEAELAK